jgi:hypothetical protein
MTTDDGLGVELMRLYRQLRAETDPVRKDRLRRLIDAKLTYAEVVMPASYIGVSPRARRF